MSSKPNAASVSKLKDALKEYRILCAVAADARQIAQKLPDLEQQARLKHCEIINLLESMDCKADGNMGWEGRITWMLLELVKQDDVSPEDPHDGAKT